MGERQSRQEMCSNCPDRSRISKMLAQIAGTDRIAEDCEGLVTVSHGQIVTQTRTADEPSPPRKTWSSASGSLRPGSERRYSRVDWTEEKVCGKDTIQPREGESLYKPGEMMRTDENGNRFAAFISGDEVQLQDHYAKMGIIELLDSVTEMQIAESENDEAGVAAAHETIEKHGFSLEATAGRHDGKKQADKSRA